MFKKITKNQLGEVGLLGEDIATDYLLKQGYRLIGRNVVAGGYEIDIIVEDLRHIVFVEVKTRTVPKSYGKARYGPASAAVDRDKKRHITAASTAFLKEHKYRKIPRNDIIEVYLDKTQTGYSIKKINHYPNSFGKVR